MYLKLDNDEFKMIERASNITCTDYDLMGNFIPVESMLSIIEDLILEIDRLEENYKDLENDLESNYRPLTNRELYGDIEII